MASALQVDARGGLVTEGGVPAIDWTLKFFEAGTSTPKNVFTDPNKTGGSEVTEMTLNSFGRPTTQIYGDGLYKVEYLDENDVSQFTDDFITFETNESLLKNLTGGSLVDPTISFGDGDSGFIELVDDEITTSIAGVGIIKVDSTGLRITGGLTATTDITITGDFDTTAGEYQINGTTVIDPSRNFFGVVQTLTDSLLLDVDSAGIGAANGILIDQAGVGDSALSFLLTAGQQYVMGIDNSGADSFKISNGSNFGLDDLEIDTSGNIGLGRATIDTNFKVTVNGAVKATNVASSWINFNGTGVVAIRDDYNVDLLNDLATGQYEIDFTNDLANANYCLFGSAGNTVPDPEAVLTLFAIQTDLYQIRTDDASTGATSDFELICCGTFGGI